MLSRRSLLGSLALSPAAAVLAGCANSKRGAAVIGVAFETLQTEYWVASRNAIEAELRSATWR